MIFIVPPNIYNQCCKYWGAQYFFWCSTPLCSFILYQRIRIRILPVAQLDSRLKIHFPWLHLGLIWPKEFKSTGEDYEDVNKSSAVNSDMED